MKEKTFKKIQQLIKKREKLLSFGTQFLDGFLPSTHPYIMNPKKRQRLRIYNGVSLILIILLFSYVYFLKNKINFNLILVFVYACSMIIFMIINYITKSRFLEFFLFLVLLLGILLNFHNAYYNVVFPPTNFTSFLITIIVLHFIYNRWISLLYISISSTFLFLVMFHIKILELNHNILLIRIRYFYDYVFASLTIWFIVEIYEHFREELEFKLKNINLSREKDLELASEIQKQLYPQIPNYPSFYIDYWIQPYDQVSGDYLDIIVQDNHFWIILGDVTGHGLQSGMLTMQINTLVNYLITEKHIDDIFQLFLELNNHYYNTLKKLNIKNYASLTIVKVYTHKGIISIVGTLNNIFHYKEELDQVEYFSELSHLLGLRYLQDISEIQSIQLQLQKQDILFFCTDGLTELPINTNEFLDLKNFQKILYNFIQDHFIINTPLKIKELFSRIELQYPNYRIQDDITAILLQYKKTHNSI